MGGGVQSIRHVVNVTGLPYLRVHSEFNILCFPELFNLFCISFSQFVQTVNYILEMSAACHDTDEYFAIIMGFVTHKSVTICI